LLREARPAAAAAAEEEVVEVEVEVAEVEEVNMWFILNNYCHISGLQMLSRTRSIPLAMNGGINMKSLA
jgi:hypothetical protein